MKVEILEDGLHRKEVNPLGREPIRYVPYKHAGYYTDRDKDAIRKYDADIKLWREAEESRKVFEIVEASGKAYPFRPMDGTGDEYYYEPGTIHEAERIPGTDKIKIL